MTDVTKTITDKTGSEAQQKFGFYLHIFMTSFCTTVKLCIIIGFKVLLLLLKVADNLKAATA
jgi:hypothetical protein